jgi:hypothetical protein
MKAAAAPVGSPWMWTLIFDYHEDRSPTHGYQATREAAMAAFAKSWRREWPRNVALTSTRFAACIHGTERVVSEAKRRHTAPPARALTGGMLIKLSIVLSSVANLRTFGRCAKLHQSGETAKTGLKWAMAKRACVMGVPSGFAA